LLVAALVMLVVVPPAEGNHCECFTNNNTELRLAVQTYVANSTNTTAVAHKYGYPISTWCVDSVTDMSRVFDGLNFTESLSGWNTGKATTYVHVHVLELSNAPRQFVSGTHPFAPSPSRH
jgi:Mycoplasma protein of unknown function, DUF285